MKKLIVSLLLLPALALAVVTNRVYLHEKDYFQELNKGNVKRHQVIPRFGKNAAVGTSFVPVTTSGAFQMPTALTSLEIVSSSANDAAAGSGARTVEITGINDTNGAWTEDSEIVTLNGIAAVALSKQWRRINKVEVLTSGTYGTTVASSHNSTLTLRVASAGATWAQVAVLAGVGYGSANIGAISIPAGKYAIISDVNINVDSSVTSDVALFKRESANTVAAPFSPFIVKKVKQITANSSPRNKFGVEIVEGPADIGFMAKVSAGTADVSVDFNVTLIDSAGDGSI